MLEHDPVISEYEHEKFRPREAEALQTLRKVASLVKPIMRQRGWTVGILTEFFPPEKNLLGLNWNKGQKICLRLRHHYDERQFIPLEDVVDTMLHELSHIVHGPHDEAFHNLWNQLRTEHEQLVRKGYTGEGFLSMGHKLGGGHIPMHEASRRARAAAEKRKILTAGSGQKLGGAPVRRGEDIRRIIADAATRRSTVTKGCASGTERSRGIVEETTKNGFRTKAEEDDANEEAIMQAYIELIQEEEREKYGDGYVPPSSSNPAGSQGKAMPSQPPSTATAISKGSKARMEKESLLIDLTDNADPVPSHPPPACNSWSCQVCTLSNPPTYLCCDACGNERTSTSVLSATTSPAFKNLRRSPDPPLANSNRQTKSAIKSLSSLTATERQKPLG
ncbi:MAG: hypothetical protein Q9187_008452, partial [Circinaria calcarea]